MTAVARELRLPAALLVGLGEHEQRFEVLDGQIWTEADPDLDGWLFDLLDRLDVRHELLDGNLVVTPPPSAAHEFALAELLFQLRSQLPGGLLAFASNLGYFYGGASYSLADVTIVSSDALDSRGARSAPVLLVEVLSPATRLTDLTMKRSIYAEHGVQHYWLVDTFEQTLAVQQLQDGDYVEQARVQGTGELSLDQPFPMTIAAAALWLPTG